MFGGMGNMGNMAGMMKKVQKLQNEMKKMQEELKTKTVDVSTGGGAVKIVMNVDKQVVSLTLDPAVVDPEDVEMLQDLVISAVNEALRQAEDAMSSSINALTGALNIPGL